MTTASKITLVRVAFIPVYMVFMYMSNGQPGPWMWGAFALFVIALEAASTFSRFPGTWKNPSLSEVSSLKESTAGNLYVLKSP